MARGESSACLLTGDHALKSAFLASVRAALERNGYWVGEGPSEAGAARDAIAKLGRCLGTFYVPQHCSPDDPVLVTAPSRRRSAAPFDRPEPIGWHGDFASHEIRPDLSIVHVTRADPAGDAAGAWRLASVDWLIERLSGDKHGRRALRELRTTPLPFSYAEGQAPRWFTALATNASGQPCLRFFAPSIRRGFIVDRGEVPDEIEDMLRTVEHAADAIGKMYPTSTGALLVTDNWRALHDRTQQSVPRRYPSREALLAFVSLHDEDRAIG